MEPFTQQTEEKEGSGWVGILTGIAAGTAVVAVVVLTAGASAPALVLAGTASAAATSLTNDGVDAAYGKEKSLKEAGVDALGAAVTVGAVTACGPAGYLPAIGAGGVVGGGVSAGKTYIMDDPGKAMGKEVTTGAFQGAVAGGAGHLVGKLFDVKPIVQVFSKAAISGGHTGAYWFLHWATSGVKEYATKQLS